MRTNHVFGRAPKFFALEADSDVQPDATDEEAIRIALAATRQRRWVRGSVSRFAERVSETNAHRIKVRRISTDLQRIHAERRARREGASR